MIAQKRGGCCRIQFLKSLQPAAYLVSSLPLGAAHVGPEILGSLTLLAQLGLCVCHLQQPSSVDWRIGLCEITGADDEIIAVTRIHA